MRHIPITWANLCTLLRVALLPYIWYAIYTGAWGIALAVFMLAALSDIADGWCARALHEETEFGRYLDPIVDKVMIISCYSLFAFHSHMLMLPQWFLYTVVVKEMLILIAGVYIWGIGCTHRIYPACVGKGAMVLQVAFVMWLFISLTCSWHDIGHITLGLMWLTTFGIVAALLHYIIRCIQAMGVSL